MKTNYVSSLNKSYKLIKRSCHVRYVLLNKKWFSDKHKVNQHLVLLCFVRSTRFLGRRGGVGWRGVGFQGVPFFAISTEYRLDDCCYLWIGLVIVSQCQWLFIIIFVADC